jgi:hypothetical protein
MPCTVILIHAKVRKEQVVTNIQSLQGSLPAQNDASRRGIQILMIIRGHNVAAIFMGTKTVGRSDGVVWFRITVDLPANAAKECYT